MPWHLLHIWSLDGCTKINPPNLSRWGQQNSCPTNVVIPSNKQVAHLMHPMNLIVKDTIKFRPAECRLHCAPTFRLCCRVWTEPPGQRFRPRPRNHALTLCSGADTSQTIRQPVTGGGKDWRASEGTVSKAKRRESGTAPPVLTSPQELPAPARTRPHLELVHRAPWRSWQPLSQLLSNTLSHFPLSSKSLFVIAIFLNLSTKKKIKNSTEVLYRMVS